MICGLTRMIEIIWDEKFVDKESKIFYIVKSLE